jgi:hypothetical protein
MEEVTYENLVGVLAYLKERGYKASKSSLYLHAGHGKIHARKDGLFHVRDIEKYAKIFLKRRGGAPHRLPTGLDSLQKEKLSAETIKLKAQAEHWQARARAFTGSLVPRELFEQELAKRASVFKNDLESFARAEAMGIVGIVDGNPDKAPDLVSWFITRFKEFLRRYSEDPDIRVPALHVSSETNEDAEIDGDLDDDAYRGEGDDFIG